MFACVYSQCPTRPVVDIAYAFSPLVEEVASDTAVLDIAGCNLLFGQAGDIAKAMERGAVESGCRVNVAVARNPDAAIHAARRLPGITIIPPGEESKYLADLPLNALCPSLAGIENDRALEIIEILELWGMRSFQDLATLPEAGG